MVSSSPIPQSELLSQKPVPAPLTTLQRWSPTWRGSRHRGLWKKTILVQEGKIVYNTKYKLGQKNESSTYKIPFFGLSILYILKWPEKETHLLATAAQQVVEQRLWHFQSNFLNVNIVRLLLILLLILIESSSFPTAPNLDQTLPS